MTNREKLRQKTGIEVKESFAEEAAKKYHGRCWICPAYESSHAGCKVASPKPTEEECKESLEVWLNAEAD